MKLSSIIKIIKSSVIIIKMASHLMVKQNDSKNASFHIYFWKTGCFRRLYMGVITKKSKSLICILGQYKAFFLRCSE